MPLKEGASFQARLEKAQEAILAVDAFAKRYITEDGLFNLAASLSEVRAPSGTVSFTLGPKIKELSEEKSGEYRIIENNPVLSVGNRSGDFEHEIVISAHGDEVSYGIKRTGRNEVPLWANCAHRQSVQAAQSESVFFPAEALRYAETLDGPILEQIANGVVATDIKGNISFVTEHGPEDELRPGDRVVFNPFPGQKLRLRRTLIPDRVEGLVDNRIGMVGGILIAQTMKTLQSVKTGIYPSLRTRVVFDDREEGVPDGRFGGGMQDFVRAQPSAPSTRYIVYDGHDAASRNLPTAGLLTEVVSGGKGPILTPQQAYRINKIAQVLIDNGADIKWDQDTGVTTSRSADNGIKNAGVPDSQITVVGYSEHGPHHQDEINGRFSPAVASLHSAVESARLIVSLNTAVIFDLL